MRERVEELRYGIGDVMGDYAPDYFRRSRSSTTEILIGAGSMLAALGIGYLAIRLSDRRMGRLIDRFANRQGLVTSRERAAVHGTSGAEMPDADRMERSRRRAERQAVHQSDGSEWPKPESSSRP